MAVLVLSKSGGVVVSLWGETSSDCAAKRLRCQAKEESADATAGSRSECQELPQSGKDWYARLSEALVRRASGLRLSFLALVYVASYEIWSSYTSMPPIP